jgi:SPP1 gp7 family putative phage head morphogenesis protein
MAKTSNEEIMDALLRHQTYLLRYSGYVRNKILALLDQTEQDVLDKIRSRLANNDGLTTSKEWKRLEALVASIGVVRGKAWDEATRFFEDEMVKLAFLEPVQIGQILTLTLPVQIDVVMPADRLLRSIALSRPFEGRILSEWAEAMQEEELRRISNAIKLGMTAGEDMETIARRVVGTGRLNHADGILSMTRAQVQAVTRTAVMNVSNQARSEFLQANSDIIHGEYFVATLDSRTTPICRAMDGKTFDLGKGPIPPLHFNCRSLRVPAIDGILAGNRPAKPYTERQLVSEYARTNGLGNINSRDALPRGTKGDYDEWSRKRIHEIVGPIPAKTTYQEWLKGQSTSFQDDILGQTKAQLFRKGGLTLDKFVNRNGDELSLAQLARTEADAFRAAGLDPSDF